MTMRAEKNLSVAGVTLTLTSEETALLERAYAHLSELVAFVPASESGRARLRLEPRRLPDLPGETIYQASALVVKRVGEGFSLRCGAAQLQLRSNGNVLSAHCFLADDFGQHSAYEQREFFLLGLLMLLRPQGCYGLHACGLERHGAGLLLVGASGSGKTTTSLQLIDQGWRYLSDDAVLLRQEASGDVRAHAFRRGFSCTAETLAYFPGLAGASEFGDPGGKRVVYLESAAPGSSPFTPHCTPSSIVFPTLAGTASTRLRPLSNAQSLLRLCQQSAGIMTDVAVSQGQLTSLTALTLQARSFELLLGQDALEQPDLAHTLITQTLTVQPLTEGAAHREAPVCAS